MTDQPLPDDTALDLAVLDEEIAALRAAAFTAVCQGDFEREAELRRQEKTLTDQYAAILEQNRPDSAMRLASAETAEAEPSIAVRGILELHQVEATGAWVLPTLHGTIPG